MTRISCLLVGFVLLAQPSLGQTSTEELQAAVDGLGDFDYDVRMEASRALRRADPEAALPLLLDALRSHADSYVQFRAIVLISGLELTTVRRVFEQALDSPNDRVRAAAYEYFEQTPSPEVVPKLLAAIDSETSEFVRPYLVRALAAHDDDAVVQDRLVQDIDRGQEYFRGAVIEALGDHRASYAVESLIRIISDDGPLRDDALLALGKIGDGRAVVPLAQVQRDGSARLQPVVSATACLLEVDCDKQFRYIVDALTYGADVGADEGQALLRSASSALAALASDGRRDALDALLEVGLRAADTARAPIALALGTVALRNPEIVRTALTDVSRDGRPVVPEAELLLLRDAFDMLDEDFAEERFYVLMRQDYWGSLEGSHSQVVAEAAIRILEF